MDLSKKDFEQSVILGKKTALIEFWAPWCTHCRRLARAYETVAAQSPHLLVAKINIDTEPEVAQAFRIDMIPTLLLFRDGKAIDGLVAPDSKASIDSFLRRNLEQET